MPLVLIEKQSPQITVVTLNRPERRNALTIELMTELTAAIENAAADASRDQSVTDQTAASPLCRVRDGHDQQRGGAHGRVGFAPLGREAASA